MTNINPTTTPEVSLLDTSKTKTSNPVAELIVPTIDIAPYLANPNSLAAEEIVDKVRKAAQTTGFFSIVGHGVPKDVQQGIFEAAKKFFALPYDEKIKLDSRTTLGHRGYDVLASQSYIDGVLPDLKEVSL